MRLPFFRLDWHSLNHLLGSYTLTRLLSHLQDVTMLQAAVIALLLGIAWELMDNLYAGQWIFDSRGGDITDVVMDAAGGALALIV